MVGVPKYDHPHLNVTKVLVSIAKEKTGTKEEILAGEDTDKIINVATYETTVENDGDRALFPVYVRDIFLPGPGASLRLSGPQSRRPRAPTGR